MGRSRAHRAGRPAPAGTGASPGRARTRRCASGSPARRPRAGSTWSRIAPATSGPGSAIRTRTARGVVARLAPGLGARRRRVRRPAGRRVSASRRWMPCATRDSRPARPIAIVQLRRRGGCPVRRCLRRLAAHHRRARRRPRPRADRRRRNLARRRRWARRPAASAATARRCAASARSSNCTSSRAAAWSTSVTPWASVAASDRTAGGGSTCPAPRTTPARPRWPTGDDASIALADVVLAARKAAATWRGVATCGKVQLTPNGVNAIPSHATVWLDARAAREEGVRGIVADVTKAAGAPERCTEESWTGPDRVRRLAGQVARRRSWAASRCSTPAPGTTPASSPRPASRPRCCSSATRPASRTRRPSSPTARTAWPASPPSPPSSPAGVFPAG